METISNFFKAAWAIFSFAGGRSAAKNTADMKANAAAQADETVKAAATKAVAADDLDAIRKGAAE